MKRYKVLALVMVALLALGSAGFAAERVLTVGGNQASRPITDFGINVVDVFYVDSTSGDNGRAGKSPETALATVDYAIGKCTANAGNIIYVMPGHTETFTAANGFDADVAGISIIGVGSGADMPEFIFTGTAATVAIGAANVTIENCRFLAGISEVVMGISVEAAGDNFTLKNCMFPEPTTSTFEFLDAIDLASGADGVTIDGCVYFNMDATGANHFLEAGTGVNNNLTVKNSLIMGEFAVAAIWSNKADLEVLIENCNITNATNGQYAIEFTAAATGSIRNCLVRTDAQATAVDPGSMTLADVYWDDDATADTAAIPAVAASGGSDSVGGIDDAVTSTLHGKIGTDTEMGDSSLYDLIPNSGNTASWNATALAAIQGEAEDALEGENLDHLAIADSGVAADADLTAMIADGSFLSHIMTAGADTSDYQASTDSLEAISGAVATIDEFHDVPAADNVLNAQINEVVGNKEDAAAAGAVTTTDTLVGYIKQLVTAAIAIEADTEAMDTAAEINALWAHERGVEKSDGAILTGSDDLFTITGGPVRCKIVGVVTTIVGGATNLRLQHTTTDPAATVDLNAGAVACDNDAVGTIYYNVGATSVFTPSTGLGFALLDPVTVEETEFILQPGTVKCLGDGAQTGNIKWYMTYQPLSADSVVAVAP